MTHLVNVGVIGLGAMGFGMAQTLSRSGFEVAGFDINPEAASRLRAAGCRTVSTIPDLARFASCIICVVATSDQASEIFFNGEIGALRFLQRSSIIVLSITARPDFVNNFKDRVIAAGRSDISVIDCPVSGGESRAIAGTLSLMCSGDTETILHLAPVFECLGSQTHTIPGGIGAASRVKFVHQIFVAVNIAAAVEVFALSKIAGLNLAELHIHVMEGEGGSWLFGQRVSHLLDPSSVPASSLAIIAKDIVSL